MRGSKMGITVALEVRERGGDDGNGVEFKEKSELEIV